MLDPDRPVESASQPRLDTRQILETLLNLDAGAPVQRDFDQTLFTVRGKLVKYSRFILVVREIARVHRRGVLLKVSDSFQIVGQTGSGKSSLAKWYRDQFPAGAVDGRMHIPVLLVETPETPTVKSLAEAVLIALGDPWPHKGSTTEMTQRIKHFCKVCVVEIIIFDEIQHFNEGNRHAELLRVTDWFKSLINQVCIPVVLIGLPRSIPVTRSNPQLRRRFSTPYYLAPFGFETAKEQLEFRGLMKALATELPAGSVDVSSYEEAVRFFHATCGLIDYLVKLLDDAGSRGGSGPAGAVTREDFAVSFLRVIWGEAPPRLNPFGPKAKLRRLDKDGEPFEMLDDIARYLGRADRHKGCSK